MFGRSFGVSGVWCPPSPHVSKSAEHPSSSGVLVITPAFNEEAHVGRLVTEIRQVLPAAEIVVVNDGSTDATASAARAAGAVVLSNPFNMGYGVALQTGYKYARTRGADYILQLDADGQHEPASCRDMLAVLQAGTADVVIGSRHMAAASYTPPLVRRVAMRFFAVLASLVLRQRITDPTSVLQGFRRDVLRFLVSDYFPVDYPDADVIIMLHRCGYRIAEIPAVMRAGTGKSMHSGFAPVYYVFKMLLSMFVSLLRRVQ